MISVIIPTIDVSATISAVVKLALADARVSEVIVVDDGSIDGTPELAIKAGARVITSTLLGKGASMRDGLNAARNDLLIYLDGDLSGLRQDLIARLAGPMLDGDADFVKAGFSRGAGRVTALTARPMTHHPQGCPEHGMCKLNVLRHLTGHSGFASKDVIAVGDGDNDICLLRAVPLSFAFRPKSESVRDAARCVIDDALSDLLEVVFQAEMLERTPETDLLVTAQ